MLTGANSKKETIKPTFDSLKRICDCLVELDNDISNNLLEHPDLGKYKDDYNVIKEYTEKMDKAKMTMEIYFEKDIKPTILEFGNFLACNEKEIKLLKMKLVKFSSQIKSWLSVWSQFKWMRDDQDRKE